MAKVQRDIRIAAPPEAIFLVLDDIEGLPDVIPGLDRVWDVRRGTDGHATYFRWVFRMLGLSYEGEMFVDEYVPDVRVVNRGVGELPSLWRWECQPEGDGWRLTMSIEYTVPGGSFFGGLANKLVVERQNERNAEQALATIKARAERAA